MTALIVILAVAYTLGTAMWFGFNLLSYWMERGFSPKAERRYARQALQAPLWPLLALEGLRAMIAAAREEGSE